ncbi:MAG: glycosyltransferase family 9 protein [Nitrospirota bacterium]
MIRTIAKHVLLGNPEIDEVIFHDVPWNRERTNLFRKFSYLFSKNGIGYPYQLFKIVNYLKRKRFDVAIDLRGDYRNIFFFTYLIGARCRISFNKTGGSYFLTHSLEYIPSHHELDKNFRIAQLFGIKKSDDYRIKIPISKDDYDKVNYLLENLGIKENDILIALHPGSKQIQRWRAERFGELGDRLIEMYKAKVLLTGVLTDKDLEVTITKKIKGNLTSLIGKTSLKELTALMKRINLLICNDTGVLHLASFMNTPTIALFGPTDPEVYSHRNITVIRKILPCVPCNIEKCKIKNQKPGVCMDELIVDDIFRKIHTLLSNFKGVK